MLENGTASIHLDYETKIKIEEELEKRKNDQKIDNTVLAYDNNSYDNSFLKDIIPDDGDYGFEEPLRRR